MSCGSSSAIERNSQILIKAKQLVDILNIERECVSNRQIALQRVIKPEECIIELKKLKAERERVIQNISEIDDELHVSEQNLYSTFINDLKKVKESHLRIIEEEEERMLCIIEEQFKIIKKINECSICGEEMDNCSKFYVSYFV